LAAKNNAISTSQYTLLADKSDVDRALQQVKSILHDRPTEVRQKPLVDLPKNYCSPSRTGEICLEQMPKQISAFALS
jgi:hypothetical protein